MKEDVKGEMCHMCKGEQECIQVLVGTIGVNC
jgi:hypothetical protein